MKGATGKRWWYDCARCGEDTRVNAHTWQLPGSSAITDLSHVAIMPAVSFAVL